MFGGAFHQMTTIVIGHKHDGSQEVICGPEAPVTKALERFREFQHMTENAIYRKVEKYSLIVPENSVSFSRPKAVNTPAQQPAANQPKPSDPKGKTK